MEEISFKKAMKRLPSFAALYVGEWQIFYLDEEKGNVWVEPEDDHSDLLCWIDDRWVPEREVPTSFVYKKPTYVHGYTRRDGTRVKGYYRELS